MCKVHVALLVTIAENQPMSWYDVVGDVVTSTTSLEFFSRSRRDVMIDIATLVAFFGNYPLSCRNV